MKSKTLEEVRTIFKDDKFATENGAVIDEIGGHYAKCSMKLEGRHKNAIGAIMGGVYFMLADFAFAVAANWEKMGTVSLNSSISYLGTAQGEQLTAEAVCVKDGRTTCYYRIDVYDGEEKLVAAVTSTGYHKE